MRVALVQARTSEGNTFLPPLGLLSIAAVLEQSGHEVKVIDVDPGFHDPIPELVDYKPDIVGFTVMTTYYAIVDRLIRRIRNELPKAIICAGGIHCSGLPERTVQELGGGLDFVVRGEGEYVLAEVASRIESGQDYSDLPGTVQVINGEVRNNGIAPAIEDLNALPFPARHLIDMKQYLVFPGLIKGIPLSRTTQIITSRGCPMECIFCSNHQLFYNKTRQRSVDNVINEIEHLIKTYDINGFGFYDDTFLQNPEWVKEFCRKAIEKNWNMKWSCLVRANQLTDELAQLMKKAGCVQCEIGVESGRDRLLKLMKKGMTTKQIERGYEIARQNGLRTVATCIIGFPTETEEDMKATGAFVKKMKADFAQFFFLTPFPGSEIYLMAVENGWIPADHQFDETWDIRAINKPMMAIEYPPEKLIKIRAYLQNSVATRNYYFFFRHLFSRMSGQFIFELFISALLSPREVIQSTGLAIKTGRFDHIPEGMLRAYRHRASK